MKTSLCSTPEPGLPIWVIYLNPSDAPGKYVTRLWRCQVATQESHESDSIESARSVVPTGLMRFPRATTDDPVIVESWI